MKPRLYSLSQITYTKLWQSSITIHSRRYLQTEQRDRYRNRERKTHKGMGRKFIEPH